MRSPLGYSVVPLHFEWGIRLPTCQEVGRTQRIEILNDEVYGLHFVVRHSVVHQTSNSRNAQLKMLLLTV